MRIAHLESVLADVPAAQGYLELATEGQPIDANGPAGAESWPQGEKK